MMIKNKDLKRCSRQVFTYSAQYQAPFYGREKSIIEMQKKTAALKSGEVLVISQPLGTGKTFLVNHMISEGKISVPRNSIFLTAKGIDENPDSMNQCSCVVKKQPLTQGLDSQPNNDSVQ